MTILAKPCHLCGRTLRVRDWFEGLADRFVEWRIRTIAARVDQVEEWVEAWMADNARRDDLP